MSLRFFAVIISLVFFSSSLFAETQLDDGSLKAEDLKTRERLSARMAELTANEADLNEALYYGELRSTLCKSCHGKDGNATKEGVPSLAGQNPVYIVDQFNRYASGRRDDYWMGSLAKNFKESDKIKLAIYYSHQKVVPAGGGNAALVPKGKELYGQFCAECHGDSGNGTEGYANLAGQRPEYLVKMLKEFKTTTGKRYNPWMYARANMLKSDEDMEAVAAYLANLK